MKPFALGLVVEAVRYRNTTAKRCTNGNGCASR